MGTLLKRIMTFIYLLEIRIWELKTIKKKTHKIIIIIYNKNENKINKEIIHNQVNYLGHNRYLQTLILLLIQNLILQNQKRNNYYSYKIGSKKLK